mgnify:CR=1 FL=1
MATGADASLATLAAAIQEAKPRGLVDLYLERVADTAWELEGGTVVGCRTLLREAAAARFRGLLRSADGITRLALAEILGIPGRAVPPVTLPPFPATPELACLSPGTLGAVRTVRVRSRWAAVLARGDLRVLGGPALCELTLPDGQRTLTTWPPPADLPLPPPPTSGRAAPDPGPVCCLLAPPAAAALLHEAVGHALEGDTLVQPGRRPALHPGTPVTDAAFDVVDDPTRAELPGAYWADDEGTPAHPTVLVRAGSVAGLLADREVAERCGVPAGNARRSSAHAWPRPRVSNLVVTAREAPSTPCREGAHIEVASVRAGAFEPLTGELRLLVRSAWALRGGRRVRPLGPFVLAGQAERVLAGMRPAGPPAATGEPGWCGKAGDMVPVGAVTPWLVVSGLEVR